MVSAYVKHRYADGVASFLQPTGGFVHSCHFVLTSDLVKFVMVVTYTANGLRLSCTEFEGDATRGVIELVKVHFRVGKFSPIKRDIF